MEAIGLWLQGQGVLERPADIGEMRKGHGRLEIRELWLEESSELGAYLEAEYGWPGLKFCGLIRRRRCRRVQLNSPEGWEEQEEVWVAGEALGSLRPPEALDALRGHWEIENRLYWVRDVSFGDDRLQGRKVGPGLSMVRNLALNWMRVLGYRFVVDGFRFLGARAERGLSLLIGPPP